MDIQTIQTLYILPLQDRCCERPKITLNHHDTNVRQMYFSASDAQIFFQIVCSNVHTLLFFSIRKLIHWIVTKKLFDNFIMLVILVGKGSATYFIQIKIFIVLFSLSLSLSFYSQNSAFRPSVCPHLLHLCTIQLCTMQLCTMHPYTVNVSDGR